MNHERSIIYGVEKEKDRKEDKSDCEETKIIPHHTPICQAHKKDREHDKKGFGSIRSKFLLIDKIVHDISFIPIKKRVQFKLILTYFKKVITSNL